MLSEAQACLFRQSSSSDGGVTELSRGWCGSDAHCDKRTCGVVNHRKRKRETPERNLNHTERLRSASLVNGRRQNFFINFIFLWSRSKFSDKLVASYCNLIWESVFWVTAFPASVSNEHITNSWQSLSWWRHSSRVMVRVTSLSY